MMIAPTNPSEVMVIRKLTSSLTTLSTPFWRFGHLKVGGRGTLVRLQNGSVAVFSPIALTPEVKETVTSMGDVKYIAALDLEHHIFLGPWHQAFPNAKVIGPEGLPEKRTKQKNEDVPFSVIFSASNKDTVRVDSEFDAEFEYEYFPTHPNKEIVFFHKPERALIEADLMFNLPANEQFSKTTESPTDGLLTKLWICLNNTQKAALGQKRFLWYAASSKDRPAFNLGISKVNSWNFDKIIPCHGDVIESGGKGVFERVFQWHIEALKKKS